MSIRLQGRYIPVLLALILMVGMGSAATTEVHIVKYAVDGTTVLNETTVTYQWMMNNLPVLGDGVTHYYAQGPVFKDDPDPVIKELIRWNVTEDTNVLEKDMGAVRGTNVKDLCDLVGGMNAGETIKMTAPDGFTKYFAFKNVYEYSSREGPMVVTWEKNGLKPDTGYTDGMRLVWLADASTNPWGVNAFGNWDWHEAADSVYWYYYVSGAESYPTTTGLSVQTVSDIIIYSDDPVPVAPTAGFISDVQSGTAPLTVNFTDTSTGTTPLTYAWDFGDGTVDSTIKDPSHEYTMAGTYTVNLTVANAAGIDSEIKPDFITVNPPPDTTAPASVTNLTNTTFSQTLITWTWTDPADSDFEKVMVYLDGVWKQNVTKGVQSWTATGLFPDTEYTIGTRTVDTTGNMNATMVTDVARTAAVPDITAPASVTNLANTTFAQTSITWTWTDPADSDFEKVMVYLDGVWKQNVTKGIQSWTATGLVANTEYTIGTRTIDSTGNVNATTVSDPAWTAPLPPADNTPPASVTNLANTTFAQTSITWTWTDPADSDFEKVMVYLDGVWKQNVTKGIQSWTATGLVANTEYTIGTRTIDSTGNVNATTVSDPARTAPAESPHAQFTASPRDGPAPLAVQFTDQSTGSISSRSWDFTNDGTVDSTLANPVFTYSNPGTYTVNLTVMGPGGLDTEIKTGFISVEEPASGVSAQFTASPLAGSVPLTVRFTDQSSGEITSYAWDFNGDGTVDSRVKNPVTVYTSSGTYTVTLTVRGPDGMDTEVKTKYLSISGFLSRPNALFSMDKQFGSAPLTVHFTDKTLNNPDTFLWKFGDGTTSAERNPSHTYLTAGFYKVSLTASNEAGSSSRAMYVFVSGF
ncbi:MAG TPA: PKD domain-containing protein [Methanoregulaceae archaeon]|nr:PKD domain-containing protein [Methanoregulaceae archaeon]